MLALDGLAAQAACCLFFSTLIPQFLKRYVYRERPFVVDRRRRVPYISKQEYDNAATESSFPSRASATGTYIMIPAAARVVPSSRPALLLILQ